MIDAGWRTNLEVRAGEPHQSGASLPCIRYITPPTSCLSVGFGGRGGGRCCLSLSCVLVWAGQNMEVG